MTGGPGGEMEKGTKCGRTLTKTLVGISGAGAIPWFVILVVTGGLVTVLYAQLRPMVRWSLVGAV